MPLNYHKFVQRKQASDVYFCLEVPASSNSDRFLTTATPFNNGDVQISKDGGAVANTTNLPTQVTPSKALYKLSLTQTELDAIQIQVLIIDQDGPAWRDCVINLETTLALGKVDVNNPNGDAIRAVSTGGSGINSSGDASAGGAGLNATGFHGIVGAGSQGGSGLKALGGATGAGITAQGGTTSGDGIVADAPANGHGILAQGGTTHTNNGIYGVGRTTDDKDNAGAGIAGKGSGQGSGMGLSAGKFGHGLHAQGTNTTDITASFVSHGFFLEGGKGRCRLEGLPPACVNTPSEGNGFRAEARDGNGAGMAVAEFGRGAGLGAGGGKGIAGSPNVNGGPGMLLQGIDGGEGLRLEVGTSGAFTLPTVDGIVVSGNAGGHGLRIQGGTSGNGILAVGGVGMGATIGEGIVAQGFGGGAGLHVLGGATGHGLRAQGGSSTPSPTAGDGIQAEALGTGDAISAYATDTNARSIFANRKILAQGNIDGVLLSHSIRTGVAAGGATGSITLDASASTINDFYNGATALVISGTGAGQARTISAYNGTTKVATVSSNWKTAPANGDTFVILP